MTLLRPPIAIARAWPRAVRCSATITWIGRSRFLPNSTAPSRKLITEAAWGHVWSRPTWTTRERSIVTIALLAALGQDDEVAMHVRATANTGATREDICEALLHVAIYAGVPAANHAIKIAKQVFAEIDAGTAA